MKLTTGICTTFNAVTNVIPAPKEALVTIARFDAHAVDTASANYRSVARLVPLTTNIMHDTYS
jgi:hypothetical protein